MNMYRNLIFVVVCLGILAILLMAPEETTPRTPDNQVHVNPNQYENCTQCHLSGGDGPTMRADHLGKGGALRLDHTKCYMCHKPEKR
jgi:hypothetical protein